MNIFANLSVLTSAVALLFSGVFTSTPTQEVNELPRRTAEIATRASSNSSEVCWTLVDRANKLKTGNKIIFTSWSYSVVLAEKDDEYYSNSLPCLEKGSQTISFAETQEVDTAVFTLSKRGNRYVFETESGGYLSFLKNNSSSNAWYIRFYDDGTSLISTWHGYSLYNLGYDASNNLFDGFASKLGNVQIYSLSEEEYASSLSSSELSNFVNSFHTTLACDPTGRQAPKVENWNSLASQFSSLSLANKQTIASTTANEYGSDIERCVYLYDYVIAKYGEANYKNFIGREIMPMNVSNASFIIEQDFGTPLIIVFIGISMSISAICLLKKKSTKE